MPERLQSNVRERFNIFGSIIEPEGLWSARKTRSWFWATTLLWKNSALLSKILTIFFHSMECTSLPQKREICIGPLLIDFSTTRHFRCSHNHLSSLYVVLDIYWLILHLKMSSLFSAFVKITSKTKKSKIKLWWSRRMKYWSFMIKSNYLRATLRCCKLLLRWDWNRKKPATKTP